MLQGNTELSGVSIRSTIVCGDINLQNIASSFSPFIVLFLFSARQLISDAVYHISGAHLIEKLVLLNSLRLRSWRVRSNMTDPELREILLAIRGMELKNILLYTSSVPEYRILSMVRRNTEFCPNFPISANRPQITKPTQETDVRLNFSCRH